MAADSPRTAVAWSSTDVAGGTDGSCWILVVGGTAGSCWISVVGGTAVASPDLGKYESSIGSKILAALSRAAIMFFLCIATERLISLAPFSLSLSILMLK